MTHKKYDTEHLAAYESWWQTHWRSAMGWQYFMICVFDFMVAPILFAIVSYLSKSTIVQWQPLTIQGGGLYHLAMGAVLGITSWAKSNEKVAITNQPKVKQPVTDDPEK